MKFIKNIVFCLGLTSIIILITTFILTTLSYFNIINEIITTTTKMIITIISVLISGIILGKNSQKKGWLEGLKLGTIISIILLFLNIIGLNNKFKISNILFYGILLLTSIIGSMIGISKKKIKTN